MKKIPALLTATALMLSLAACGDFAPDPTDAPEVALDYAYTDEDFPSVYGSSAYEPLMEAVAAIMLGTTREDAAEHLTFGATDEAWAALASGDAGVVIAPEGSNMPSGVDTAAISRDALVFFVGEGSSVSDLSSDELRAIFTGSADSWDSYGGSGAIEILARPEGSGSIAALDRLIGCDAGLVTGVEPTAQSISSGEYSLALDVLAGVSSSAADDSAERTLWLWLQGSVGQAFISSQGYLEAE